MKSLLFTFTAVSLLAPALAGWSTNPQGNWVNGPEAMLDYGDAPDTYATAKLSNGPSHRLLPGLRLGARIDAELDGIPSGPVGSDDRNGVDDEDGVRFVTIARPGNWSRAEITVVGEGKLDAWIDFNRDGHFNPDEQICRGFTIGTGVTTIHFYVPEKNVRGLTYSRWRLSKEGVAGPCGAAASGEVEDHPLFLFDPQIRVPADSLPGR